MFENIITKIRNFFAPRQKWLTKKIPKHWVDKPCLIRIVAFESIIHFVEIEDGLDSRGWESPDGKLAEESLRKAYILASKTIPDLIKKEDELSGTKELKDYFNNDFIVPIDKNNLSLGYRIGDPSPAAAEILEERRKIDFEIQRGEQEVIEAVAKYREYMWV